MSLLVIASVVTTDAVKNGIESRLGETLGAKFCPTAARSGHIDRVQFVPLSPPDWCRLFDIASG